MSADRENAILRSLLSELWLMYNSIPGAWRTENPTVEFRKAIVESIDIANDLGKWRELRDN